MMENVAIPIHVSAFVLTPECAESDGPDRIGLLTQPNYMGLRLDEALMQHDLVDHVDFHLTSPAKTNARLTDIGAALHDADPPPYRRNRMGVYLHWSLPRCYRAARKTTESRNSPGARPDQEEDDLSTPQFPTVPNRWLVVRRLTSQRSDDGTVLPEFQSWIVESNRVRRIQDIDETVDIEVEVSNFMRGNTDPSDPDWRKVLERQAEICIGKRNEYSGWSNPGPRWREEERGVENDEHFMDLTVLSSSNPMFPDYTPHNGSVFSIIDSFKYQAQDGSAKYLLEAKADYFVIGWNALAKSDVMEPSEPTKFKTTLEGLSLSLAVPQDASEDEKSRINSLLEVSGTARSVIHGAVYGVPFKWGSKPPSKAKRVADKFGPSFTMEPLSAGVTPLDGIITFLRAHKGSSEVDAIFGDDTADEVAEMVLTMSDLLYAANDSFDERAKAQDINTYDALYGKSISSGYQWNFAETSEPGKPPKSPSPEQFATLLDLNEKQARFDALDRKLVQLRHELFCEWWKYVSDKTNILNTTQDKFRAKVDDLAGQIRNLENSTSGLTADLEQGNQNPSFKRVTEDPFYMRKEPTVCIAGLESGWPKDFLDVLPVRVDSILTPTSESSLEQEIFQGIASPFPAAIRTTALKILGECRAQTRDSVMQSPRRGFQFWGTENPFEPLFLEWEALYYHIDRSKWTVGVHPSPVGLPTSHLRYGVSEVLSQDPQNQRDRRWISGRTLILPQPVFSLKAAVKAVIDSDPSSPFKDPDSQAELMRGLEMLQFMSCPLSGLQEHLTTQVIGTHVKPTINKPGKTNIPLIPAAQPDIGFAENVLKLIDSMSDMTPYGNLQDFPASEYPMPPFKSVTHGQLIITKLNIIDKFGQGVALPAPKRKLRVPPEVPECVHPCLSDFLIPDIVNNQLNTIYPEVQAPDHGTWPMSRFMQLTPAINQNSRLNATFVNKSESTGFPFWHETENDKPESPIFGWIVVNYQDLGLQFFRPDGRFYREVRVGGPENAVLGSKWLPFDPPGASQQTVASQLDELIAKMIDKRDNGNFLKSFFHMINGAIRTMPYAPSEYSGYANALVGKPLALVNAGFSLELATPALKAQNTLGKFPLNEQQELSSYQFPVKLGDAERPFDGVVGWFDTDNTTDGRTNWNKVYSYAPDPENSDFEMASPRNFIRLSPHYLDPVTLKIAGTDRVYQSYRQAKTAQYIIKTMLIDPYTPVHTYSPILPITSLSLPPWTIQQAMTRMTAFFRLGPCLVSSDVPTTYDESRKLDPETWAAPQGDTTQSPPMPAIRLPVSGKHGLWRWLQPYDVPGPISGDHHDTRFNEMDVNQEDTAIRKDPPPYTMVEGYLQLARPLLHSDVSTPSPGA
ncbi:hypothetical protein ONS95_003111 [Cadophora gregata]|uniref:uncharacterized protein n=1 Tax=Cadophora gregata TaxID=51156 RepID=UPI0026DD2FFE|nr:uncharacterized protein ONS95_003111 [Cadophora gregata]KAK0108295.1 hypothetical protein ONS95_003111 [Cadophora gregata]